MFKLRHFKCVQFQINGIACSESLGLFASSADDGVIKVCSLCYFVDHFLSNLIFFCVMLQVPTFLNFGDSRCCGMAYNMYLILGS